MLKRNVIIYSLFSVICMLNMALAFQGQWHCYSFCPVLAFTKLGKFRLLYLQHMDIPLSFTVFTKFCAFSNMQIECKSSVQKCLFCLTQSCVLAFAVDYTVPFTLAVSHSTVFLSERTHVPPGFWYLELKLADFHFEMNS